MSKFFLSLKFGPFLEAYQIEKPTSFQFDISSNIAKIHSILTKEPFSFWSSKCIWLNVKGHNNQLPKMNASEKLCLQWNDFKDNVTSSFGELREDKDLTDVTLA